MDQLKEMGEFVRSASSTIEAPVVRRLKEAFSASPAPQDQQAARSRPAGPSAPRNGADGGRPQQPGPRPGGGPSRTTGRPDAAAPAPRVAPDGAPAGAPDGAPASVADGVTGVTGRTADQAGAVAPDGASPRTPAEAIGSAG